MAWFTGGHARRGAECPPSVNSNKKSPNHPAGGNAGAGVLLAVGGLWPGVPQPGRSDSNA